VDPDLLLDEPTKLADTLDQIEQTLRSCKLHHAGRNYLLDLRALALELKRTGGWGHVTACFWRLVLPPAEEGDWVVHSYMLYPASRLAIYIGAGGVGKVFRAGSIQHATSACIAVDRRTDRVLVLSSRGTSASEPWLLAWGGWSND
jgi:hypothetical protein